MCPTTVWLATAMVVHSTILALWITQHNGVMWVVHAGSGQSFVGLGKHWRRKMKEMGMVPEPVVGVEVIDTVKKAMEFGLRSWNEAGALLGGDDTLPTGGRPLWHRDCKRGA
eukprot:TRINITY_DN64296_c0_g1_i5.p3 TRINITY_DN64296_c0_g1~~TRINITY_DN64296_c0_g1_i5.p3  ORF type:complete len:112 (-),score=7.77 TRINITY_DN64296_c0_g1_i5:828-1163(-)